MAAGFSPRRRGRWVVGIALAGIGIAALVFLALRWTDTTQGFRAYSRRILLDPRVAPFRDIFANYELLAYLSYRIPKLGYTCVELPTSRLYPKGQVPTKISSVRGNLGLLTVLIQACLGRYNPDKTEP